MSKIKNLALYCCLALLTGVLSGCHVSLFDATTTAPIPLTTPPISVQTSTQAQTPVSTSAIPSAFDPQADRFVILSGPFTSSATSTLLLTIQDRVVQGTAVSVVGSQQEIRTILGDMLDDGSITISDVTPVSFNYNAVDQTALPVVNASGTWSNDGHSLSGFIQEQPHPMRPFFLHSIQPQTAAALKTISFKKDWNISEREGCSFERSYPALIPGGAVSVAVADKVNAFFAHEALAHASSTSLDEAAAAFFHDCSEGLRQAHKDFGTSTEAMLMQRSSSQRFQVTYDQADRLSVLMGDMENSGGAYPAYAQYAYTIDLKTGNVLRLQDVVAPEHLRDFMQLETKKLLRDRGAELLDDARIQLNALLRDHAATTTAGQLATFGRIDRFYLAPDALVMFYDEYELAPHSSGTIEVRMPYAMWQTWQTRSFTH